MISETREFAALINNFGPRNYLTNALINYTFKAHFQRLAADADVAGRWGVVGVGGRLINALPLSVRLVSTHRGPKLLQVFGPLHNLTSRLCRNDLRVDANTEVPALNVLNSKVILNECSSIQYLSVIDN